jgi:hypothetical protein
MPGKKTANFAPWMLKLHVILNSGQHSGSRVINLAVPAAVSELSSISVEMPGSSTTVNLSFIHEAGHYATSDKDWSNASR